MNDVTHSAPDPSVPKAQAAAHYASVAEQADELKNQIAKARNNIRQGRNLIRETEMKIEANEEFIVDATERRAKLLKKKRIFARAKVELEEVDEE